MNVIRGTHALTKKNIWIWLDHIVAMTSNTQGGAVIHSDDGQTIALIDKPEEVIETIKQMAGQA